MKHTKMKCKISNEDFLIISFPPIAGFLRGEEGKTEIKCQFFYNNQCRKQPNQLQSFNWWEKYHKCNWTG